MRIAFVSNYINHHQIPFCNEVSNLLVERELFAPEGEKDLHNFTFIQTEKMDATRVQMGWHEEQRPGYVKCFYEEEAVCREIIENSDVVIFGGCDDESYIAERLQAGKPVLRYSERLYKTGQWKAVSPRGLKKKYMDHTRYRKAPVYLLCAGAYVASDYHIVRAYPKKMFCWGYFPETKHYNVKEFMEEKGFQGVPYILWAGRMIDWKHPELAMETARYLKEQGMEFHMDIIGGGELYPEMERLLQEYALQDRVRLLGFKSPEEVRAHMEKADIYLFTSDRQEGWGAVANEAMNSCCALVGNHMIGAVPYLVQNGENGFIYKDGNQKQLFELTKRLVEDKGLRRKLGGNAYDTIVKTWNAENAAKQLLRLIDEVILPDEGDKTDSKEHAKGGGPVFGKMPQSFRGAENHPTPGAPAPVLSERSGGRLAGNAN